MTVNVIIYISLQGFECQNLRLCLDVCIIIYYLTVQSNSKLPILQREKLRI
jgi:hypothetical protein